MSQHIPVRRFDTISQQTQDIIARVTASLDTLPKESAPVAAKGLVAGNFVKLSDALASERFTYAGKGLYKEADTDTEYGRVWVVKEFEDPATGTKEKWLVSYTTDEDEIIRQLATEARQVLAAAQPAPKAKDIPLAPGLKSKNLTLDETGGGGTAKVTLEFSDVDEGLKFYQEQQGTAPEKKEEPKEEGAEAPEAAAGGSEKQGPAPAAPAGGGAPVPPVPPAGGMAAPAQANLKPTVVPISRFGHVSVAVLREHKANVTTLTYINEKGEKWTLGPMFNVLPGRVFTRPDTGETARFAGYIDVNYVPEDSLIETLAGLEKEGKNYYCNSCEAKFSDKQMRFHSGHNYREYGDETSKSDKAEKTAADVSDNVPPMSFKTDESKEAPAGAGPALPPNPALQEKQPQDNVLYDSNQDKGPQFQTTIDPKQKSVTVKFVDSEAEQALQNALGQPQQPAVPTPGAPMPGQQAPGAPGAPAPGPGAQTAPFDQQQIPTEF